MLLADRWSRFWFADARYFDLALLRIGVVGFQLYFMLDSNFGALTYVMSLPDELYIATPRILRLMVAPFGLEGPPAATWVFAIFWATLLVGIAGLVGLFTNVALCLFAVGSLFLQALIFSYGDFHHPEAALLICLMALALSPAGKVMSIDAWLRRGDAGGNRVGLLDYSGPYAGWPIRFIQCFFPLMYISAAVAKIAYSDYSLDWANGYTLQYYFIQDDIRKASPLALWASQFHWPILIGQFVVLFYQLTYFIVVPYARLRWIYLPIGLFFHFANYWVLKAPFPQWILLLLLVYIPWAEAFKRLATLQIAASSTPPQLPSTR